MLITGLAFDNATGFTHFTLAEPFVGNASAVATALVGSNEHSLRPVAGRVQLAPPPTVRFSYPAVAGRRTWLQLCAGCVARYRVEINATITCAGSTYVVFGVGIDGLPSCGADCLLLDRPFTGPAVSHGAPALAAFPVEMPATATAPLGPASPDALRAGDALYVATASGTLDALTVVAFDGARGLRLKGNFSERCGRARRARIADRVWLRGAP